MKWFSALKAGLKKTASKLSDGITSVITKKKLDEETLEALEELLISSDLGVSTSAKIIEALAKTKFHKEVDTKEIKIELANIIADILEKSVGQIDFTKHKPHVVLVCGVNGNGKTTTIGKIAAKYRKAGKKVTLGACDTFRAAAGEQLKVWAQRSKSAFVAGELNADPASVAYKALEEAKNNKSDMLLLDTAGRLANKTHLMDELSKINRVIQKHDQTAPHDVILVLDATTGQHALSQVESFKAIVNITGIIVTKLDGSAKAGIVVAIGQKFNIPIIAIGVGEAIDDLDAFSAKDFAQNLVGL